MVHDPYTAPNEQYPSNLPDEIATQHTLRPLILPILLTYTLHTATNAFLLVPNAAAAYCLQAWHVLLLLTSTPPPPSLSNQTLTIYSNRMKVRITILKMRVTYSSSESPSEHPLWSNRATRPMEVQDSEARPRPRPVFNSSAYETDRPHPLPLAYSGSSTATLCLTRQSQLSCSTSTLMTTCANLSTCAILL